MTDLPRSIKLGGQQWAVKHRRNISGDETDYLYGRAIVRHAVIQIDKDQADTQKRETLLHELLHACLSNLSVSLGDNEEEVVRGLAPWLLAAVRDNPQLVAYLLAR